jgi:cytochrome c5
MSAAPRIAIMAPFRTRRPHHLETWIMRALIAAAVAVQITVLSFVTLDAAASAAGNAKPRSLPVQAASLAAKPSAAAHDEAIARGRYLVQIGGCNDCHTAGYPQAEGKVPESEWLTGVPVGFKGGWGTSYPSNLRLTVAGMTEDQWARYARAPRLPPMPWFSVAAMSDSDLRAMYRFIRSLGAKGTRAPSPVAPGGNVTTPVIVFEPQMLQAGR